MSRDRHSTDKRYLLSSYSYHLLPGLIAQEPARPRDSSRLMVCHLDTVGGKRGGVEERRGQDGMTGHRDQRKSGNRAGGGERDHVPDGHFRFRDLPDLLSRDDILVINDSRVIPARVRGRKTTGGRTEVLFLSIDPSGGAVEALIRGRIREGATIIPDRILMAGESMVRGTEGTGNLTGPEEMNGSDRRNGMEGEGGKDRRDGRNVRKEGDRRNGRNEEDRTDGGGRGHTAGHMNRVRGPVSIRVLSRISEGRFEVEVRGVADIREFLDAAGEMPLPPYIRAQPTEAEDYQTVYSREAGSVAAPTAGLHFTEDLLRRLRTKGIRIVPITLHVSIGTFLPVRDDDIRNHTMEPEYFRLGPEAMELLEAEAREFHGGKGTPDNGSGKRWGSGAGRDMYRGREEGEEREPGVIAVGTTVVKTLESAFGGTRIGTETRTGIGAGTGAMERSGEGPGRNIMGEGWTYLRTEGWSDLFIYPGHRFASPLKGMITNFHLPASTLIMLVSAYAGRDRILNSYETAVREGYRFYSFGDAMFLRGGPPG